MNIRDYKKRVWRLPKELHKRIVKEVIKVRAKNISENTWAINFISKHLPSSEK